MKKLYYLGNYFNLIFGIFLFINTYLLYSIDLNVMLMFIGLLVFEIIMGVSYIKKSNTPKLIDYVGMSVYFVFIISSILFMLVYQARFNTNLNMVYFSKVLFIPHFLYAIIGCLNSK